MPRLRFSALRLSARLVPRLVPSLLLVAALPGSAGAQADPPAPVRTSTHGCGAYTMRIQENGFGDPPDRLSITRGAQVYATVEDERVAVDFCRDVTGDGVPEVLMSGFSGGAHCCFTHTLYSLTTPPRRVLEVFSAHSDTLDVRQLDGRGPLELVGADWRFAYAYGLSFAESAPLPVVYSYLGGPDSGLYVDNSRAFPGFMQASTRRTSSAEVFNGGVLASYATQVIVGGADAARSYAQEQPRTIRAWLENYGPDIRQSLSGFGMWDWPTRTGVSPDAPRSGIGGAFSGPGTREWLALVGQGQEATLRLYGAQGPQIVAGPVLERQPLGRDFSSLERFPALAVRRASGQDDALMSDTRSGSLRFQTVRVVSGRLSELQDDPLALTARLLGDLGNVARQVAASYARPPQARTPAQRAEVQRRIDVALGRAQPWLPLTDAGLDLRRLGTFAFDAVEMPVDRADHARIVAPVSVGFTDEQTDSPYISGERMTLNVALERGTQGWAVTRWTLEPRPGELSRE